MTSVRKAERKQNEKLSWVPVWPLVAFLALMALLVYLVNRGVF
ncbi:MAG TPA: hypothetical protein VNA20_14820 [Frankiaceae bacterium]|nr:hypothetical protein [Frankiaceae bacterium]